VVMARFAGTGHLRGGCTVRPAGVVSRIVLT
jgi:hypothetical protein